MSIPSRQRRTILGLLVLLSLSLGAVATQEASAAAFRRHYYSSWSYYPQRTYYYSYYYYKPYTSYAKYDYHYCVYYPSRTRYVYYYNPVRRVYWGRYDLEKKGYSLLAEDDRKANLDEIPEAAFPEPGEMPAIPGAKDGERMIPIDPATLPTAQARDDAPGQ